MVYTFTCRILQLLGCMLINVAESTKVAIFKCCSMYSDVTTNTYARQSISERVPKAGNPCIEQPPTHVAAATFVTINPYMDNSETVLCVTLYIKYITVDT